MLKGVMAALAAFAAISGNTTVMGAGKSNANEVGAGAVSIFEKINSLWVQADEEQAASYKILLLCCNYI